MPLRYRPARIEDLEQSDALVVASINELTERHAFGPMARTSPPLFQRFSLQDDPDGLWIAEDSGEIVGFAFSWASDRLWFLAQLFVAPGQQGRGIGNELMRRTLQHADRAEARHRALITFAFNRVSQALYIRNGLFPRMPLYFVGGARDRLMAQFPVTQLRTVPIAKTQVHLRQLAAIDQSALGATREKHHGYLLADGATKGMLLFEGQDCAGYAYIAGGHIGPLAAVRPDLLRTAFVTALRLAAEDQPTVSAFVPGSCEETLKFAIDSGMQITFPMLLMSDHVFGDWTRYLPRNPGFM